MEPAGRGHLIVRTAKPAEIRSLRQIVLRPGQPETASIFPGDDDEETVHFGAYRGETLVGIASLYREPRSGADPEIPGWRLRGMATSPDRRGVGIGRAILEACTRHVAEAGGGELWCNARTTAMGFYARAGFEVVSEEFEVEGIGPHVVMRRLIPPSGAG